MSFCIEFSPPPSESLSVLLHAGEGCADGGETLSLSGSSEGTAGDAFRDFGWYFESWGITPPYFV
jgi:hypothetical protein